MTRAEAGSSSNLPRQHETVLENDSLRVVVLPELGGKIYQITYKPLDADILWNHPAQAPSIQVMGASYDDHWCGGWDELFPNDEPGDLIGQRFPDHGELWTGAWDLERVEAAGAAGAHLSFTTPISHFHVQKEIYLRQASAVVEVRYRLINQGRRPFPFLFKLHPAFAVSSQHRIDFPPMMLVREPEFPGTLDDTPGEFAWPTLTTATGTVDLRQVLDVNSRAVYFMYGAEFEEGWCGITDKAKRLAAGLRFDPKVFSSCWLFASYGGWRDLNVAVLEPSTGYPYKIESMIRKGRAKVLNPGETLTTTVLFSVQEGLKFISGISEDGVLVSKE